MNRTKVSSVGGFNPFLFYIGMSLMALSFSIVICFSIFYAVQSVSPIVSSSHNKAVQTSENVATKAVYTSLN